MAQQRNGNGIWLKITMGTIISLLLAIFVWIWSAAGVVKDVEANTANIKDMVPRVRNNHDDIIGMKKDIAQILANMKKMERTESENTQAIINEIRRINNGN